MLSVFCTQLVNLAIADKLPAPSAVATAILDGPFMVHAAKRRLTAWLRAVADAVESAA